MKTIQECLRECNRERIIELYIRENIYTDEVLNDRYAEMTIGDFVQKLRHKLNRMIDTIISAEPVHDADKWILITTHTVPDHIPGDNGITHLLVNGTEVLDLPPEKIEDYGFNYSAFEELASFYVADTYLTQHYLDELLAFFLYEASWTGFDQEDLEDMISLIENAEKEWENEPENFEDEDEEDLHQGNPDAAEIKDPEQEEAYRQFSDACNEYAAICRNLEFRKLKELLLLER